MAWKEWAARIGGYAAAPWTGGASIAIGEGLAQGFKANDAINDAKDTQEAATQQGLQRQQSALQTAGDVYGQQRADTQNLAGQPYQTLGSLMGMNIAPIGAPAGNVPMTPPPTYVRSAQPPILQTDPGMASAAMTPYPTMAAAPAEAATLKQLADLAGRQKKSTSGYGREARA